VTIVSSAAKNLYEKVGYFSSDLVIVRHVDTDLAVSSLNSQYELSINSGSAHIPLVHCLSSYRGKGRYTTFPDAMARRYGGIGIGWQFIPVKPRHRCNRKLT
jgi:hypothetical protein